MQSAASREVCRAVTLPERSGERGSRAREFVAKAKEAVKNWEKRGPLDPEQPRRTLRRMGRGMHGQNRSELERPSWDRVKKGNRSDETTPTEPPRGSRSGA